MNEDTLSGAAVATRTSPRHKFRILVKNPAYCKACGICIELCPKKVLGQVPTTRKVELRAPELCNGCGLCEFLCPDFVLILAENEAKTAAG